MHAAVNIVKCSQCTETFKYFFNVGFRHRALILCIRFVDFKVFKSLEEITQTRERSVCMQITSPANNGFVEDRHLAEF